MSSGDRALTLAVILSHDSWRAKSVRDNPFRAILFCIVIDWTVFYVFEFHNRDQYELFGGTRQHEKKFKKGVDPPRKVWLNYLRYEEVHSMEGRSEHRSRPRQGVSQPHLQVLDYMRCEGWQAVLPSGSCWLARLKVSGAASRPRKGSEGEAEERSRLCGWQVPWCEFRASAVYASRLQVRAGFLQSL